MQLFGKIHFVILFWTRSNTDLKHLVSWSNANKISLNVKKAPEMVIQKKFEGNSEK